jgi:hypothetical protein
VLLRRRESTVLTCCVHFFVSGIVLSSADGMAATSLAKTTLIDSVKMEIENISYSGKDDYTIEMALLNKSPQAISLKGYDIQFHVQTGSGWARLNETATDTSRNGNDICLPALGKKRIVAVVRIPLTIAGLFRTYEGDISFQFRYRLKFADMAGTKQDEPLYWITPMTDKWVEREGM